MKYLLWMVVLYFGWLYWTKARRRGEAAVPPPEVTRAVEEMRACAHCGVNFPESDGCTQAGRYFCCTAHRDLAGPA